MNKLSDYFGNGLKINNLNNFSLNLNNASGSNSNSNRMGGGNAGGFN